MLFGSGVGDVLSCGRVALFRERFLRWGWLVATSGGLLADWPERGSAAGLFSLPADIHLTEYIIMARCLQSVRHSIGVDMPQAAKIGVVSESFAVCRTIPPSAGNCRRGLELPP